MQAITVTIGRNVGDKPMSADAWNTFISKVREAVESATSELWARSPYRGGWQGHPEDAFLFYGPLEERRPRPPWAPSALTSLRNTLSMLATYYGQDAIGLTVGEAELVESLSSYPAGPSPAEVEEPGPQWSDNEV